MEERSAYNAVAAGSSPACPTSDRAVELSRLILQVCRSCAHLNKNTFVCDTRKGHCHSSRVRKWLGELEKIERS